MDCIHPHKHTCILNICWVNSYSQLLMLDGHLNKRKMFIKMWIIAFIKQIEIVSLKGLFKIVWKDKQH